MADDNLGVFRNPDSGRLHTARTPAQRVQYVHNGWPEQATDDSGEVLRGEKLDAALEKHDLPKTGKADEKRARLAEQSE